MNTVERAESVIREAFGEFGTRAAVLTSFQREGVAITALALRVEPRCRVFTLDTGRLPEATLRMIAMVEERFGIHVERITPDPAETGNMVELHGLDLFRNSVPKRMVCCEIRKVRPLNRAFQENGIMKDVAAMFVGLRRGQSDSRADIPVFDRSQSPVKISPLADWSAEDVLSFTREHGLPEHPLYSQGYRSIGCDPCTRAVSAGEAERAGRWWWESEADKECGLHFTPDGRAVRAVDVLLTEILEKSPSNAVRA